MIGPGSPSSPVCGELDEHLEAQSLWTGHGPITRAQQYLAIQEAPRKEGQPSGTQAISKAFTDRKVKFANDDTKATQQTVTTHLRVLNRWTASSLPADQTPLHWLRVLENEFGRKHALESLRLLDGLARSAKTDGELSMVVQRSKAAPGKVCQLREHIQTCLRSFGGPCTLTSPEACTEARIPL